MSTDFLTRLLPLFSLPLLIGVIPPIQTAGLENSLPLPATAAQTPTDDFVPGGTGATLLMAQQSPAPRRIQFAKNKTSAVVENAVVRGTRDTYLLGAKTGQRMTVKISSLENNAVFDILSPADQKGRRRTLKQEATTWSGVLPSRGDYQIIVGGTRGNATYKLEVAIK